MGSTQANYAGSAAVTFGEASASVQASAGTVSVGANAGWMYQINNVPKINLFSNELIGIS